MDAPLTHATPLTPNSANSSPDPVLRDCPDYTSLAPPPTPKKKLKFKVLRQESNAGDDDDDADEVRMCKSCKSLLDRYALFILS